MIKDDYEEMADAGIVEAQILLFLRCAYGWSTKPDPEKARRYLERAIASGDAFALYVAGTYQSSLANPAKDSAAGFDFYLRAAKQGFAPAQLAVAGHLQYGIGTPPDAAEAFKWAEKAAKAGYAPAQEMLATMYAEGQGIGRNEGEAFCWHSAAASQGLASAIQSVASCYEEGVGIPQNDELALKHYREAARRGHWLAHSKLSQIYGLGLLGVARNETKAREHERMARELAPTNSRGQS